MVINLRGTGGSGKSTVVRRVMDGYAEKLPNYAPGRKQPISYLLRSPDRPDLRVIGHYETACGGCDTIASPDLVYQHVGASVNIGENVLYEGIIIGDDVTRCADLSRIVPLRVIALNTPMNECLAGIQSRRDLRGVTKPLSSKNTINRAERLKRIMTRLRDARVDAVWMSREEAFQACDKAFRFVNWDVTEMENR